MIKKEKCFMCNNGEVIYSEHIIDDEKVILGACDCGYCLELLDGSKLQRQRKVK